MSLGRQREPAGMPQHVRVHLEDELRLRAGTLDHAREARSGEGRTPLRREHKRRLRHLLTLQPAQRVAEDTGVP